MEGDGFAVEGEGEAVYGVLPRGSLLGPEEELVVVEEDGDGLDPGEVPPHVVVPSSDEVGVYVEVWVGYEAEVAVLLAVEVESDPIAADETRVLANSSWFVTLCIFINIKLDKICLDS